MANTKGLIVYFDGPDGAGKTTQLKLAADALRAEGLDVYETRTLGGTPVGEQLREISVSQVPRPVETDLHIALACQYALAPDITARRESGQVVLIDRSPLSILAYQVHGDNLDESRGKQAIDDLLALIKPDLTLLFQADSESLEARRHQRDTSQEYFESKPLEYHERVTEGYAQAAQQYDVEVLSATDSPEELSSQTLALIKHKLNV